MAVFTPVSEAEAAVFLERYALGRLISLEPILAGVENTNYRLTAEGGVFALTLYERRTAEPALPFCLGFMEHAAALGAPTPHVARDRDGRFFSTLNGRPASLVAWLPGRGLITPTVEETRTGAAALARLHLAGESFAGARSNPYGPKAWDDLIARSAQRPGVYGELLARLEAEAAALHAVWPSGLPHGAIHADAFPDNMLFDEAGAVTAIIDFGFACVDALAYDLAIFLVSWGFTPDGAPLPDNLAAALAGYESVRRLSPAERASLTTLARGAALRFTLTRLHDLLFHDPAWLVQPKDPAPFAARLRWLKGNAIPSS